MPMQRKTRRIIVAVAVIALLAAGGAAFTTAIGGQLDGQSTNIGFGSQLIKGATAQAIVYNRDSNGQFINSVDVYLKGDYHTALNQIGGNTPSAAASPWVFTGSLTNNSGDPLVWEQDPSTGSGRFGWYPYNNTGQASPNDVRTGGSGYAISSGSCSAPAAEIVGGTYDGTTKVVCDFTHDTTHYGGSYLDPYAGSVGVPVDQVEGFQLAVASNDTNASGSDGTSATLDPGADVNPDAPVAPVPNTP